jgi:hypothetical protein
MYIWNTKGLAEDLRLKKQMSQREKFKYLFFLTIIGSALIASAQFSNLPPTTINIITEIACFMICVIGLYFCYQINSRGDDKEFIERSLFLSVPIGIRVGLLGILICGICGLIIGFFFGEAGFEPGSEADTVLNIITIIMYVVFYIRLYANIKIVSQVEKIFISIADEIKKLADLLEQGKLTKEEFEKQKTLLLDPK